MNKQYLEYFRYAPRLFWKKNVLPLHLILFVTSRCNARCGYCFNWQRAEADHEDLTRGAPRDPRTAEADIENYRALNREIEADIVSGRAGGYSGFPFASLMNAKNLYSREVINRIVEEDRYLMPCYAGLLAGNVFKNGDVFPCELLDQPIGNLRDWDYDFTALWRSAEAEAVRRHIRDTRCYCTHECYLNTTLLFNPRNLPPIGWRWLKSRWGRPQGVQD